MINKRMLGTAYEEMATAYLKQQGFSILENNFRCRLGEIDIIAKDGSYLVFIEVKYRSDSKMGYPAEAVDRKKQLKICKVADYYRIRHALAENTACRFDVVVVMDGKIDLFKNAFEYRQYY